jgi:hypothetical protein
MVGTSLEISVKGKWVRVPALKVNGKSVIVTGRWIKMAAIHDDDWSEGELEGPEECIRRLKERGSHCLRADIFTFAQKLPTGARQYPYRLEWDNVAAIRLNGYKDWWQNQVPQETRKNARRSLRRGVVLKIQQLDDELVRGITEINNETPTRQGKRFWHYGKSDEEVKKDYSSFLDRSDFICAYFEDELIGLLKIVYSGKVGAILQLLSKKSHYDKRPANALIAKAVERCEEKGITYITYGKYRYGNQGNTTLMNFKMRNGFREMLVGRFYVPLTAKGKTAMMLNLHRELVDILPQGALALVVHVRANWHRLRNRSIFKVVNGPV